MSRSLKLWSRRATAISQVCVDLRRTSVGCAVKHGADEGILEEGLQFAARDACLLGIVERPSNRADARLGAGDGVGAGATAVMGVFRDVGEMREV